MSEDDRRTFTRFEVHVPARVKLTPDAKESYPIEILDISLGGARIKCAKPVIKVGQVVYLEVNQEGWKLLAGQVTQLDEIEYLIDEDASSSVQWANHGDIGTFGIKFNKLTDSQIELLQKILIAGE